MFKIFNKNESGKETVFLKLIESFNGGVDVIAVDKDGRERRSGNLVRFTKEGCLKRHPGVSIAINIKRTSDNMIELVG